MAEKEFKISFWTSHLTLIASVTFVLLLTGVITSIWMTVEKESDKLREKLRIDVILADSISDSDALVTAREIAKLPYSKSTRLISKKEALKIWKEETGEDLIDLYGINPLSSEIEFFLRRGYSDNLKIDSIQKSLAAFRGVESVEIPDATLVSAMNSNLRAITWGLAIAAGIMLVITLVLINNTVHLVIYSKRFTIHTMQLVGATNSFISRPIVLGDAFCGLIAGISATGFTYIIFHYASKYIPNVFDILFTPNSFIIIATILISIGVILCTLSSWVATARYLNKSYDKLFK